MGKRAVEITEDIQVDDEVKLTARPRRSRRNRAIVAEEGSEIVVQNRRRRATDADEDSRYDGAHLQPNFHHKAKQLSANVFLTAGV